MDNLLEILAEDLKVDFFSWRPPKSRLAYSTMAPDRKEVTRAWEALTPPLSEWILDAIASMGFSRMTPVQANCIPLFLGNKDVVVEVMAPLDAASRAGSNKNAGCHRKWKNSLILDPNRRETAQAVRSHQETSRWCHHHSTHKVCDRIAVW
jgi:hypothetical protein